RSSSSVGAGSSSQRRPSSSVASWTMSSTEASCEWRGSRGPMSADNLTILVAVAAGLLSFLSPCVLPLVPAYIGQLTAVAVADASRSGTSSVDGFLARPAGPSRWTAFRHALAYVAGFGAIFTLLGITATFAAAGLSPWMPVLREIGGVILVLLGLNLAGILRIPALDRNWRPLVRHGRAVSIVGGLLVVAIGLALIFNWLALLAQYVPFNNAI